MFFCSEIVFHIPHSATVIPPEELPLFCCAPEQLRAELLKMTDRYTDLLFALPAMPAENRVVMPVSRLVCDPERFRDDAAEAMAAKGMGWYYTNGSDLLPIKAESRAGRERALARYDAHHAALNAAVGRALSARGRCLLADCHSFPSRALPYEDPSLPRPEICLGTDAYHTPAALTETLRSAFERRGYSVGINTPFAGTLVPVDYYRRDTRVSSVMIELNRSLYMDEHTGEKSGRFAQVQRDVREVLEEVIEP